jgi:hypothetical protein
MTEKMDTLNAFSTIANIMGLIAIGILLLSLFKANSVHNQLKSEAIEKGYACYNSTNGVWQWK